VSPDFLEVEDVLDLHARLIQRYGGLDGLRDPGLLESATGGKEDDA
jgi:death-on-curing protein